MYACPVTKHKEKNKTMKKEVLGFMCQDGIMYFPPPPAHIYSFICFRCLVQKSTLTGIKVLWTAFCMCMLLQNVIHLRHLPRDTFQFIMVTHSLFFRIMIKGE